MLARGQASLFTSTYQAGKLVVVRENDGRVSTLLRTFEKAMGLAVNRERLAIGTRREVWVFGNSPEIGAQLEPRGKHDACFSPRWAHVTGDISVHEIAWGGDELWVVNTRFSCLCTLDPRYSFVPRWRPPFVSELAAEDRCHLNGVAMDAGRPRFVTALGATDAPEGCARTRPREAWWSTSRAARRSRTAYRCRTPRGSATAGCGYATRDEARWRRSTSIPAGATSSRRSPATPAAWRCAGRTPSSAFLRFGNRRSSAAFPSAPGRTSSSAACGCWTPRRGRLPRRWSFKATSKKSSTCNCSPAYGSRPSWDCKKTPSTASSCCPPAIWMRDNRPSFCQNVEASSAVRKRSDASHIARRRLPCDGLVRRPRRRGRRASGGR
ncbi:MAG: TIGR03032 family protein [Planctomycetes bacterium]|nr:TIGR03032 family protein [Planctomycetota bacterium]